jgi:hypothetical protein
MPTPPSSSAPLPLLTFAEVAARPRRLPRRAPQWSRVDDASAEDLHELQQAHRHHRYQMETVVPLWRRFGKMWVGEGAAAARTAGPGPGPAAARATLTEPHQPRGALALAPAPGDRRTQGPTHVRAARHIAQRLLVEKPKAFRRKRCDVETAG